MVFDEGISNTTQPLATQVAVRSIWNESGLGLHVHLAALHPRQPMNEHVSIGWPSPSPFWHVENPMRSFRTLCLFVYLLNSQIPSSHDCSAALRQLCEVHLVMMIIVSLDYSRARSTMLTARSQ